MTKEYKKVYMEVLDILDVNLGIEGDIITNRFATATKLIEHLKQVTLGLPSVSKCSCNKPLYVNKGDVLRCSECDKAHKLY